MFYDRYCELCHRKGVSPSRAAIEMGISKGTVSVWKIKGTYPQAAQLQKIADYFGVTTDYLLGSSDDGKATVSGSQATNALSGVDFALYGAAHDLTEEEKEDVLTFVNFLKSKRGE